MRSLRPIIAMPLMFALVAGCARTETPEEAREAAQATYAEYDRLAAEARGDDVEEDIVGAPSPGQINTGGSSALTPGSWTVATIDGERTARFGEEGENPRITIACETGGGIDVRLIGMPPQGGSQTVYFSSPEGGSTFTASAAVDDVSAAYISVPAADPLHRTADRRQWAVFDPHGRKPDACLPRGGRADQRGQRLRPARHDAGRRCGRGTARRRRRSSSRPRTGRRNHPWRQ